MKKLRLIFSLTAILLCNGLAISQTQIINISTGLDSLGNPLTGMSDDDWHFINPHSTPYADIVINENYPEDACAGWIGAASKNSSFFTIRYNFTPYNFGTCNASNIVSAKIVFTYTNADDKLLNFKVNTGFTYIYPSPQPEFANTAFNPWAAYTVNIPPSAIVNGVNNLDFEVWNYTPGTGHTPVTINLCAQLEITYASALTPTFTLPSSICFGQPITANGTGTTDPSITNHVWTIAECDATGNVIGSEWWSPWSTGLPGIYTFPNVSSGGPNIQCGKYYKVKLAVQNPCNSWAQTTQIIFVKCLPYTNAGPDVSICNGNCVTIGTVKPRGANYSYSWYYGTNEFASTAQVTVCPTSTTTYYVTVTDNINGCSNTDAVTVTVENNNPGFSLTANTTNPTYMSLSANPNQTTGMPVGFGHMWFIDELDASLNPVYSINSSNPSLGSCWWTFPGAEVFDGFDGLTYTLNSACLPNPGKFKYNTYYRITRGVWSTNCPWAQTAFLVIYTKSNNGVIIVEDNNAPDMSAYAGISTDAFDVIPQIAKVNEINIYPNPAENVLYTTYNINEGSASIIQLTDMTGRVFKTCQLQNSNGKVELNISEYQNGVYCVNLVTNGKVISSRKLIISK